MKVCTDSCIFGAYVSLMEKGLNADDTILDVGAGTGLLSLMLAQKFPNHKIHGIEADYGSYLDCRENFMNSNWSNQLTVDNIRFEDFAAVPSSSFQLIVCNPPFFLDHLKSPDLLRNSSMHNTVQNWQAWLVFFASICGLDGRIWLLLDSSTWQKTREMLPIAGLFEVHNLGLIQTRGRLWRNIVCLKKLLPDSNKTFIQEVYTGKGGLNNEVKSWLQDYYL